jgi:hypothetical protein
MSRAQCCQSIAILQSGARRRRIATDGERGAGTCGSGAGTRAARHSTGACRSSSHFATGCGTRRRGSRTGGSSSARPYGRRRQKTSAVANRRCAYRLPGRFRCALSGRAARRLRCFALPASQCGCIVAALPRSGDGDRRRPRSAARGRRRGVASRPARTHSTDAAAPRARDSFLLRTRGAHVMRRRAARRRTNP